MARRWLVAVVVGAVACSGRSSSEEAPDGGSDAQLQPAPATPSVAHERLEIARSIAHSSLATEKALEPRAQGLERVHESGVKGFGSEAFRKPDTKDFSKMGALLPLDAGGAFRFGPARVERWALRAKLAGAKATEGVVEEGRVVYTETWPSTDVIAMSGERHAEMFFLLHDAQAPTTFELALTLGKDLSLRKEQLAGGAVEWIDRNGDGAVRIEPAFAIDSVGTRRAVTMRAIDDKVTFTLDPAGLQYPILIDPLVSVPIWGQILNSWTPRTAVSLAYTNKGVVMFGGLFNYGAGTTTLEAWQVNNSSTLTWTDIPDPVVTAIADAPGVTWKGNFLYFGGCNGPSCSVEQNVAAQYDGTSWSPFCGGSAPSCGVSARAGHMMAAANGQLVLFGGHTKADASPFASSYLNDTYVLESTSPTNVFTAATSTYKPSARTSASMAGSDDDSLILLFGGDEGTAYTRDTWFWKKTGTNTGAWQCVCNCYDPGGHFCASSPPPRSGGGLTYDSKRKKFILFGGYVSLTGSATAASSDDTWEFDPVLKKWTLLCGLDGAPCGVGLANDSAAIAFDPVKGRVIQAAGYSLGYRNYSYQLYVRGGTCTLPTDCDTGNCVDGTCCETASCPTCQTCGNATSPGVCSNVTPAGTPDDACAACGSTGTCKKALGVVCGATSECAIGYCTDGVCCQVSSCGSPTDKQCAPLVGGVANPGTCKAVLGKTCAAPVDCLNNQCADNVCCGSASCGSGSKCNYASAIGTCKKDQAQGCGTGTECGSGFCADGYCCNAACAGQCEACDGVKGTCTPTTGDPHGTRAACAGTPPCGASCNGVDVSACHLAGAAVSCGTPSCASGIESDVSTCDGSGACKPATKSCGPFTCGATACKTTCATSADCGSSYYCKTGVCAPKETLGTNCTAGGAGSCASGNCTDGVCCNAASCAGGAKCNVAATLGTCAKPLGVACATSAECGTGFCVDGVCCDTGCGGQCQACDVSLKVGTCSATTGAPHGTRPACGGTGAGSTCGSICDGSDGSACHYPGGAKSCGAATCVSSVETHVSVCNGSGSCSDVPKACGGFLCATSACKTSCTSNPDCTTGYYCKSGACIPIEGLGTTCVDASTCTSGFCTNGVCCAVSSCGATGSCSAGPTKGICAALNGATCAASSQCASGACVDGVCCDSACNGACEACNQIGSVGKCVPVVGSPLVGHPGCTGTATDPSCGPRCDGTDGKTCKYPLATSSCGTPSCAGGVEQQVSSCDGGGACKPASKSCGAYACGATSCLTSCVTSSDCVTGGFCKSGSCVATLDLGERCALASDCKSGLCTDGVCCGVATCGAGSACAAGPGSTAGKCLAGKGVSCKAADECASGHCVDGVCCDAACNGQCEACDVTGSAGVCTPVVGKPRGSRDVCDTASDTDCAKKSCDGKVRDKCNGFANGGSTSCGTNACTSDKRFQKHGACDGAGGCALPGPSSCSPWACDATASSGCKSSCTGDTECADGFTCKAGACVQGATCSDDGLSSIDKTGTSSPCAPYRCGSDGTCLKQCASSDDCTPSTSCDTTVKACVAAGAANDSGGGCATSSTRGTTTPFVVAPLFGLLALLGLRRRR